MYQIACLKFFSNDSRMCDRTGSLFPRTYDSLQSAAAAVAEALGWAEYTIGSLEVTDQETCSVFPSGADPGSFLVPTPQVRLTVNKVSSCEI